MTAEVRRHIRVHRDRHARTHLSSSHVEFCSECGDPYDHKGRGKFRVIVPVCNVCRIQRRAAAL